MKNSKKDMNENSKMDDDNSIKNDNYLIKTLRSFILNIDNNIKLAEEKYENFNENLKLITKNFLKGGKNISTTIKDYIDKYKNTRNKIENKLKFINDFLKTNPNQELSLITIKEECKLNTNITQEYNNFKENIDKLSFASKSLEKINNSKDYKDFLEFTKKIMSQDDTISAVSDIEDELNIDEENNKSNSKTLNKKRKREDKNESKIKKVKIKKIKKVKKIDLLSKLKRKYPNVKYIKKLTKTFIQRRLNHKIIYEHHFEYTSNEIKENKIKSSGDKTSYKYIKLNLEVDSNIYIEKVINKLKGEFKDGFFYLKNEDNENNIELSGKLIKPLFSLKNNIFCNISVIKELGIIKAKIYAYEFYEELAHEYQKPDSNNIKIEINEKTIQKLFDNSNMLNLVREFVKKNKK
jgi:hypothetical protein